MKSHGAEWPAIDALTYTLFDPSPCGFPEPRVPLLPMFTRRALGRGHAGDFTLVGKGRPTKVYKRGRYALYDAYRLAGVGAQGALLAPAYHCRTMLDPAISLGGELLLYQLDENLAPRLDSLRALLAQARRPVRAMLLTHYFGVPQQVVPMRDFCAEHGIALIEDCSHALFSLRGRERLGLHGRYTVASPYKLLPCEEGGLLIAGDGAALPEAPNRRPPLRAEISVLATMLQRKRAQRRTRETVRDLAGLEPALQALLAEGMPRGIESTARRSGTSAMYLKSEEGLAGPAIAGALMRLCDLDHVARQRRANYRRWAAAVAALPHCRPLWPQLPDDCAPYMFPLLIDHPDQHFHALKKLGMPIWRWDEMAVSDCPVASRYRKRLLHLPCHQALAEDEMAWMHAAVSAVVRLVPVPA